MTQDKQKLENHKDLIFKIFAISGWVLSILSLILGSYHLNKLHLEIVAMQRENKELKISLERARARQLFHQEK